MNSSPTTPRNRDRRIAAIHPNILAVLEDGYSHLLTNPDEGWSLGLISAASDRTEDLLLVHQIAMRAGADILYLEPCHLLTLHRSRDLGTAQRRIGADVRCISGSRYFLTTLPVGQGEDLDD